MLCGTGMFWEKDIPNIRIDYRGLTEYAHAVDKVVSELSEEEKRRFVIDKDYFEKLLDAAFDDIEAGRVCTYEEARAKIEARKSRVYKDDTAK